MYVQKGNSKTRHNQVINNESSREQCITRNFLFYLIEAVILNLLRSGRRLLTLVGTIYFKIIIVISMNLVIQFYHFHIHGSDCLTVVTETPDWIPGSGLVLIIVNITSCAIWL